MRAASLSRSAPSVRLTLAAVAFTGLLAAGLAGCSGSTPPAAAPTTSAGASTSTTTSTTSRGPGTSAAPTTRTDPDDPTAAILAAHKGFWDTWLAANDPPDPDHPGLRRYYTGPAYDRAVAAITKNRVAGLVIRLPADSVYSHNPVTPEITGDSATVMDCAIDDGQLTVAATGEVVNGQVETQLLRTTIARMPDDTWRVADNVELKSWQGATTCDE